MPFEIRGWAILLLSLAFFAFICAAAALSAVMQPARWSERNWRGLSTN